MNLPAAADKVASALQGTPMLLVLLLLNAAVLAMVSWLTVKAADVRATERAELVRLLERCLAKG